MASIELPTRAHAHARLSGEDQISAEPSPEAAGQQTAARPIATRAKKASSFFPRLPALKGLPFSPELAPHCDMRDYAALERTYLAFIRTSSHLASAGITIGQLFILHDDRRVLGKVLATVIILCAIFTTLLGAVEYFRQHRALDDISVYKSGTVYNTIPNMLAMAVIVLLVCGTLFVVILVTT